MSRVVPLPDIDGTIGVSPVITRIACNFMHLNELGWFGRPILLLARQIVVWILRNVQVVVILLQIPVEAVTAARSLVARRLDQKVCHLHAAVGRAMPGLVRRYISR